MPITHAGFEFKGAYSNPRVGIAENHFIRNHFAGVNGTSEIIAGRGSRPIVVNLWHYARYNAESDLKGGLDALANRAGTNGDLVLSGNLAETYHDVTFDGYELIFGPLRDLVGHLDGGWWAEVDLYFTQLTTEQG